MWTTFLSGWNKTQPTPSPSDPFTTYKVHPPLAPPKGPLHLKGLRGDVRSYLKTSLVITNKVALRNQFARKAYTPVGVSREFYQLTRKTFRGLYHNPARWQLLEYILFHAVPDERTGHLPITQTTLARIEGAKIRGGKARNYSAIPLLWWFQNQVMTPDTFQWSEAKKSASKATSKCRQITKFVLPPEYEAAWRKQRAEDKREVFFCGGLKWSKPAHEAWKLKRRQDKHEEEKTLVISESARNILDYLNHSNPRPFQQILRSNYAHAVEKAKSLEVDADHKIERELRILEEIRRSPQPYYFPSDLGHSPRIYPAGMNIASLKKDIRKAYTRGWVEADLRTAQLAINAKIWGADKILTWLEDEVDVWETFYEYFDIAPVEKGKAKGAFKNNLYAVWYQRKRVIIAKLLEEALRKSQIKRDMSVITEHPIVKEILEKREEARWQITRDDGMEDCLGNWIKRGQRSVASVMAQAAQTAEMELLVPVVEMARTTEDFQVVLFQHDGFSVKFRRNKDKWQEMIGEVVEKKAKEMGFPTGLEWEEL